MNSFDEIPDDPEIAFLHLEKIFHDEFLLSVQPGPEEEYYPRQAYIRYMTRTLAACTELRLDALAGWEPPNAHSFNIESYENFRRDVEHYRTMLEIRHSRRDKGLTVRFDDAAKRKIRHHIQQIHSVVGKLEIDEWKRDALYKNLAALELEIDRNRARIGIFGALVIESAGVLGEAAEKAEPARKWIDSIARLFWGAEMKERVESLPAPADKTRIPGPPKQILSPRKDKITPNGDDMDSEIPF
jgi:hypothetical protein